MLKKCAVISAGLALLGPAPAAGFSMSSNSIATLMSAVSRRSVVLLPGVDRPASRRALQMADKPASDASGPGQRGISSRVDKFGTREYWDEMYRGEGSLVSFHVADALAALWHSVRAVLPHQTLKLRLILSQTLR